MKRKFTTCAGRIALLALLCLVAPCLSAQFSGEGSGTADDPYRIYNAEQLYELHGYWSHRDWKSNVWYSLEADIDLTEWIEEHSPEEGWWPIGTEDSYFGGHFNGNGHTISGLRIDRPDSDNVGLFGCVDGECSIRDVRLLGAEINGRNNVGGIVGQILCEHSYYPSNEIDLVLCTVEESSINGVQSVGGIVGGVASGEITGIIQCTSENCQISGEKYVGGIAGSAADYSSMISSTDIGISRCISRCKISGGEYTGGIIGYAYIGLYAGGGIEGCVSECRIKAANGSGGIAGFVSGSGTINQCCSNVELSGGESAGGIAGTAVGSVSILNSYATVSIKGGSVGGIVGECKNSDYCPRINYCYSQCLYIGGATVAGIADVENKPTVAGLYNVSNSVAINEVMSGGGLARVVAGSDVCADNNLALDETYMVRAGERLSIPSDDENNGTSTGLSALKQQATYMTLGWDFTRTWTIQETESLPYLQMQTAPAHISGPLKVGDTQISGQYTEGGIVRVCAGDSVYTAVSSRNKWTVSVDALQIGDVVSVSVQAEGKMPSCADFAMVELAGSGTVDDPYLVRTADELQAVQRMRNDSAVYLMTNDIDLTEWIEENNSNKGWLPIGYGYGHFRGMFDGGGHTVRGLWCDMSNAYKYGWNNFGLFDECGAGSTVKSLNVEIDFPNLDWYLYNYFMGGIAGSNKGLIEQCSCSVNGIFRYVGGIVGQNAGRIEQCSVNAEIWRCGEAGGIASYNAGQIVQCSVSGEIGGNEAGGIACHNAGSIIGCSVINGDINGGLYAGGIVCRNSNYVGRSRFIGEVICEGDTV